MNPYYDSSYWAVLGGIIIFSVVIGLAAYVLVSLFFMKIFEKAGVEGKWRAWVPVYNYMVFAKLGDMSPWPVLIVIGLSFIPYLNFLTGLAAAALFAVIAWRVGLKLQKDAVWVVLWIFLSVVWLGINAFDKSRWNPNIQPAPWAGNGFFADRTVWAGVPSQPSAAPQGGYGAPGYGAAPQGYAPPAPQGYAPPAQPGYAPPAQPGYGAPAAPPAGAPATPPAPPAPAAPPATPPAPPAAPPTPPATPPAPPAAPPAPPTDPTQPPA